MFNVTAGSSNQYIQLKSLKFYKRAVVKYAFSFASSPAAGGNIEALDNNANDVTSGTTFAEGTELYASASANEGYSFAGWTATGITLSDSESTDLDIEMPANDVTLTANFTINSYALNITSANGTVAATVDGEAWTPGTAINYGATVQLTATADVDYRFSGWESDDVNIDAASNATFSFIMPAKAVNITAIYADATVPFDVTILNVTGGTITADKSNAKAGETVTISYDLSDGYVFGSWVVEDEYENTIDVNYDEQNDNYTFAMPAAAVVVSATYQKIHKVMYYVAEAENIVERIDGASLNLDTPDDINGMQFAGWSKSNDMSTKPAFVDNSTAVNDDMILYAVFAAQVQNVYSKVISGDVESGQYLIVYEGDNRAEAFDGSRDELDATNNGTIVTLSDNQIEANATTDSYAFTYNAEANSLMSASGKYIGVTSYNNGLNEGDNIIGNTITVTNGVASVVCSTSGGDMSLKFNDASNQQRFRYYKSGQKDIAIYKRTAICSAYSLGLPETVSITDAQYATFSSTQPADFSSTGITVYTAAVDGSVVRLNEVTDGIVPANTGVILFSEEIQNEVAVPVSGCDKTLSGNSLLVSDGTTATGDGIYVLANKTNGVGFYPWTSGSSLSKGRVYLRIAGEARQFIGFFSELTGIDNLRHTTPASESCYNLNGQRVLAPGKGLYIMRSAEGRLQGKNGRKYIVK
ncbi:MAG: InlB B-repeat-containing protein [Prevotella sp.]|nr:InlB B-repeat-containing protein [Prevotella sp.]